jgi:predicted  nucleic acid-binding Zn-ribbon protein
MEETTKRIIEIDVDLGASKDRLAEVNKELDDLRKSSNEAKKQNADLLEEVRKGEKQWSDVSKTIADNSKKIAENEAKTKQLKSEQSALQGQIAETTKKNRVYGESWKELSAKLADMKNAYRSLDKEQRESKGGKEMLKQIQHLDKEMKNADASIGNFQRNVGDYAGQIAKISGLFGSGSGTAGQFASGIQGVTNGFKAMTGVPIIFFITALLTLFDRIKKAMLGSEEQAMKFREALAPINPLIDAMKNGFSALADVLVSVVTTAVNGLIKGLTTLAKVADWVGGIFGADWGLTEKTAEMKAQTAAAQDLTKAENEYARQKRAWTVESAKIDRDVADLREKAADKEKYTAKERAKFLDEAIALETKKAARQKELAEENLRIIQLEAARTANDAAMNDKLAEAERAVIEADKQLSDTKRNLNNERQSAIEQGKKEIDTAKKYADLVATEMAKAEKALISLIEDEAQKRIALENNSYEESKAKLQSSLEYARKKYGEQSELYKAYASQLESLEKTHAKALEDIERTNSAEALRIRQDEIARQLSLVQKGTAEEFDLRRKLLEKKKEEELLNDKLTAEQRLLIEKQYQQDLVKLGEEEVKARQDKERKILENRIAEMQLSYQKTGELELQLLQQNIDNLAQLQGESDEDFYARRLATQKAYNDKKKALDAAEMAMEKTKANYMASIAGSISDVLETVADENKELVKASKIVALAEVAIKQGVAIAEAVASAAAGDPYTYALRVAAAIASTVAAMASAISSINSVKLARGTSYVQGPGTETSDSVPAMLSKGEAVATAKANRMFPGVVGAMNDAAVGIWSPMMSMLRSSGGAPAQVASPMQMTAAQMGEVFQNAVSELKLYVSVDEINRGQRSVQVVENLGSM